MSDELFDGRRIRLLTIVDNHTRESLAIHVGQKDPRLRGGRGLGAGHEGSRTAADDTGGQRTGIHL